MNSILMKSFYKFAEIIEKDKRCLGGWQSGSIARGLDDEYSDVDPVFVIDGKYFEEFDNELPQLFEKVCDKVLLRYPMDFNNNEMKVYGFSIQIGSEIFLFDISLLNSFKTESWGFKLCSADVKDKDIIFDRNGSMAEIVKNAPKGEIPYRNVLKLIEAYWFHIHMSTKYFKRNDYFKILKNIHVLMNAHTELLLSEYDSITWGGWDSKLSFIPYEKQEHLKLYYRLFDLNKVKDDLKISMKWFSEDAKEICLNKGLEYPINLENNLKHEFKNL